MTEPLDAADVALQFAKALDAIGDFLTNGTGSMDDKLRLHSVLKTAGGNLGLVNQARMTLAAAIAPDLDPNEATVVDGVVYRPTTKSYQRQPDQAWLRSQIGRVIAGPIGFDAETSESIYPTEEQRLARMWEFVEPATGRTKVFRDAGIDLRDAYQETGERDDIDES